MRPLISARFGSNSRFGFGARKQPDATTFHKRMRPLTSHDLSLGRKELRGVPVRKSDPAFYVGRESFKMKVADKPAAPVASAAAAAQ
jgi:hypothetical protein